MQSVINQRLIAICSCGLLASCASTETQNDLGGDVNYAGSDCISIRTIRDYTPLDRSTLLIDGGGNRSYLVSLVHTSFELSSANGISFSSRDSWLCPYGGDEIIIGSFANERLRIRAISKLNDEQIDDILIRYGKKDANTEADPVPGEEIKGAEVEELG